MFHIFHRRTESLAGAAGQPIFILGSGHSGTTLVCSLLDSHPETCCGPETEFFIRNPHPTLTTSLSLPSSYTRFARNLVLPTSRSKAMGHVLQNYCAERKANSKVWTEKTPVHIQYFDEILQEFPNARVVLMVRDGLDAVCSFARRGNAAGRDHQIDAAMDGAERWVADNVAAEDFLDDARVLVLRLEDLVASPEQQLTRIFNHCGLTVSDSSIAGALHRHHLAHDKLASAPQLSNGRAPTRHETRRQQQMKQAISTHILFESAWRSCVLDGNVTPPLSSLLDCGLPAVRTTGRKNSLSRRLLALTRVFRRLMRKHGYLFKNVAC